MDKVTIEIPDDTTLADMEKWINNEEDDKKEITADSEDEGVIHRISKEYEKDTNGDTLDKVIESLPYDTSPIEMEEGVNNEYDDQK